MFKKLISPLVQVVLWLLHRISNAAIYGIVYLEPYTKDDQMRESKAAAKHLYIPDY